MVAPVGTHRSIGSEKAHVPMVSYVMAFIRSTLGIFDVCRSMISRVDSELNELVKILSESSG